MIGVREIENRRSRQILFAALLATFIFLISPHSTLAQTDQNLDSQTISVQLKPGFNLRAISLEHLGNPDLWPIILRLNGFRQVTELEDETELIIPVSQAQISVEALESALGEIQRATESGAQIFAPRLIKNAIDFRTTALSLYKDGVYRDSIDYSNRSISNAENASEVSEANRDEKAEALLNDKQGRVEGQKPEENSWRDRRLYSILTELEKIRTLSNSTAQIIFRDDSRIRLNANSQAVIERLRADPLKRSEEAQINVISGDFYADLAKESQRSNFKVNLAEVDATIESGQFWLSQANGESKFTNYDIKPVSISNKGEVLTLGRNEGIVIGQGKSSSENDKISLIERAKLTKPEDGEILFQKEVSLSWADVEGAPGYWLEIAFDQNFDQIRENLWGITTNEGNVVELAPGDYFWRVSALDENGLPGQRSLQQKFTVKSDIAPPFLAIRTPDPDAYFRKSETLISGESEPDTAVLINGILAESDQFGRFSYLLKAEEGINRVEVVARDLAGNETTKNVSFVYLKDGHRDIVYEAQLPRDEDGVFLISTDSLSLSGLAEIGAEFKVFDQSGVPLSSTVSDDQGKFALNVAIGGESQSLEIQVRTKSGYSFSEIINVRKTREPPVFELAEPLPRITILETLEIKAKVDPGSIVTMNGQRAEVEGDTAIFSVLLNEGANRLRFVVTNRVGLVTVEQATVVFDREPPEIVNKSLSAETAGNYTNFSFIIRARDASGLAKTAKVLIKVGNQEYQGALRFNRARKQYTGQVEAQIGDNEKSLITVKLEDIAGNFTNVSFVE